MILYQYAEYKMNDVSAGETTSIGSYGDADKVARYANTAMKWACGSGVVTGKKAADGNGLILDPKGGTTRAQMATMMMHYCVDIVRE